jgi:hypothetical protein
MRFLPGRQQAYQPTAEHVYLGVSDGVFMSSRDGVHFHKWDEAFLRPGQNQDRWWQRNNIMSWGFLETRSDLPGNAPELSFYSNESLYITPERLRRYTLRVDGFVSVHAPMRGGELSTKPLKFAGRSLVINFATSAAGRIRCEILDSAGRAIPGFTLDDCQDIYGDRLEHAVTWRGSSDVSKLAGQVVRLRFILADADLYSLRFQ